MDLIKAGQELMLGKTIYDMNSKVVIYLRVGSDSSKENSDTQVNKREEFLRMIEDVRLGQKDSIFTKEVSRFTYNTADSIKYAKSLLKPINNCKLLGKIKFSDKRSVRNRRKVIPYTIYNKNTRVGNNNESKYFKNKIKRK